MIYGASSVSAQSELAMKDLAEHIKEREPELALLLLMSRYVYDLQEFWVLEQLRGVQFSSQSLTRSFYVTKVILMAHLSM